MNSAFGYLAEVHISPKVESIIDILKDKHDVSYNVYVSNIIYAHLEEIEMDIESALHYSHPYNNVNNVNIIITDLKNEMNGVTIVYNQYIYNLIVHVSEIEQFQNITTGQSEMINLGWVYIDLQKESD